MKARRPDMSDTQRLIVVLGMHRSGTSAVTRGLRALGVSLGDNLLPAMSEVNDKGFWEDRDFLALDVELLELSGLDWYDNCPEGRFRADDPRLEPYYARAVDLTRARLAEHGLFAVKDPRIPVLLPFWREVFRRGGFRVAWLIVARNPRSIVDSIERRDGFGPVKIYYLWLEHMLPSLRLTADAPRLLVDYDAFMDAPGDELDRIAAWLDLPRPAPDNPEMAAFRARFLAPELRHSRYDTADLARDRRAPPEVVEIQARLTEIGRGLGDLDDPAWQARLAAIEADFQRLAFLFTYVNDLERRLRRMKHEGGAFAEILALERRVQAAEKRIDADEVARARCEGEAEALRRRLADIETSHSWRLTAPLRKLATWLRHR